MQTKARATAGRYFLTAAYLFAAFLSIRTAVAESDISAATAWFTEASIEGSVQVAPPREGLPGAAGGVRLVKSVPVENPLLAQESGMISFWIKPEWDGDDGRTHRILRVGDPEHNGLLVEKSSLNMLRFLMASPKKVTASRSDISHWKAEEWHHVAIVWMSKDGKPLGLPLYVDKVAVAGPIASGNQFLDPDSLDDKRVWIGDVTSEAVMDELIMRCELKTELSPQQLNLVYREYFRTAPYTDVEIDPEPHAVPCEQRVVNGCRKQFGLKCKLNGTFERVTDFVSGYCNWGYFDAKPFISWTTSNEEIATVDENGLVIGKAVGRCKLIAEFRGMKDTYDFEVIPIEQPDLDLYLVERLPRYSMEGSKWWPAPGDKVKSVAHIENFGYATVPGGASVTLELMPDSNGNYRLDRNERRIEYQEQTIGQALEPRMGTTLTFEWTWPEEPVWVRVRVDPRNRIKELCEANNEICELNTALAMRWGYREDVLDYDHRSKRINLVGSFSYYDWFHSQANRTKLMLREAVYPTTSPHGVLNDIRTDNFFALDPDDPSKGPYEDEHEYYDGGFPVPDKESYHLMTVCAALVHEYGHCCLSLPDLYGYPIRARNVFLRDEDGELYSGGELLPEVAWGNLMFSSAQYVPCGAGYSPLMDFCHMWLHPAHAGVIQYFTRHRGHRFWGKQGRMIPNFRNELQLYDLNDEPLSGAAVYVYHVTQTGAKDAGGKFFADRPKFIGNTDREGRYVFPGDTDKDWDSPDTDEVDGAIRVWNPFGVAKNDTAFTPNVWSVEGLLLLKIVSGDQTEFCFLAMTDFNEAFFSGDRMRGVYEIRTSLKPSKGDTPIVRRPTPDAIKEKNLRPISDVDSEEEITTECGEDLRLDGSASTDPEGQPLFYRWHVRGSGDVKKQFSDEPVYEGVMPEKPVELEVYFYVIDGIRASEPVLIKVHVVSPDSASTTTVER